MKKVQGFIETYKGLPVSIYVLFFASVVNNMGNYVMPFLTMFLTYKVGLNVSLVGTIVAISSALSLVGTMIGGKLIDKIGRKKVFIIFRSASATGFVICAFMKEPIMITSIIMLSNFFMGFSLPVFNTMITDLTKGEQRKAAFSLDYMAINIGFSIGPLLAGFLYENYLVWLFLADAITTFISIALVAVFVPETLPDKEQLASSEAKAYEKAEQGTLLSALMKRPLLLMFAFNIVMYFIVFSQFNFGLPLQIGEVFSENGASIFGSLMTINALMCSLFTVFITSLSQKTSSALSVAVGGVLYTIGFGMIAFVNSYAMFVVSTAVWTVGEILISTNTSVYIANHTPISHRGRFNSIFPIIRKLGFILGPMLAGIYVRYTDVKSLWIFIGILSMIATLMMYRLHFADKKNAEADTEAA